VPERAAKLAIGDTLHAYVFLHFHGVANTSIFNLAELSRSDITAFMSIAGFAQCRWTQQTANVVRSKRRSCRFSHSSVSLGIALPFICDWL
jgi:hypothetical protein